jgi:hypothetical protein
MYPRDTDSKFTSMEFVAHASGVTCVTVGPKSHGVLATGGDDWKVNVWKVGSPQNIWTLGSNKSAISSLCFDGDERNVVSGSSNGSIKVFDLNVGRLARALGGHNVNTCAIQYHPHGEFIVSGSIDHSLKVWDVRNKTCIQTFSDHTHEVTCVRFSPDGRWVASSAKDGQLLLYDLVAGGRLLKSIRLSTAAPSVTSSNNQSAAQFVNAFEFSPKEFVLAGATNMRTVRLWDLETWDPITSSPADSNPARAMTFSPDGSCIYYGTTTGFKSWNWQNSNTTNSCKPNSVDVGWDKISELRVSQDNKLIGTSFASNFVSVWTADLAAGDVFNNANNGRLSTGQSGAASRQTARNLETSEAVPARKSTSGKGSGYSANPASVPAPAAAPSSAANMPVAFSKATYDAIGKKAAIDLEEKQQFHQPHKAVQQQLQQQQLQQQFDAHAAVREINRRLGANSDGDDNLNDSLNRLRSKWSSEDESKDMASSMGESFWKRFKEERAKANMNGLDLDKNGNLVSVNDAETRSASKHKMESDGAEEEEEDDDDDFDDDSILKAELENLNIAEEYQANAAVDKNGNGNDVNRRLKKDAEAKDISALRDLLPPSKFKSQIGGNGSDRDRDRDRGDKGIPSGAGSDAGVVGRRVSTASSASSVLTREKRSAGVGNANYQQPNLVHTEDRLFECVDLISRINVSHTVVDHILRQRLTAISSVRKAYDSCKFDLVCDHLQNIADSVAADPAQAVLLSDCLGAIKLGNVGLTLDQAISLLGFAEVLIFRDASTQQTAVTKADGVLMAAVATLTSVLSAFTDLIKSTRSVLAIGAVDISREERLNKCNACYDCVKRIKSRWAYLLQLYRKNPKLNESLKSAERSIDALLS